MARLREGRANTARGAAHFLRETMGRVRYAGATGLLTVRADSGCYNHAMVSTCRQTGCPLLHHHPPTPEPAQPDRGHTPRRTGRPYPTGWTALPTWPRLPTSPSRVRPTPRRCGASSAECSPRPVLNWPSWSTTAITASSPTGTEALWNWRHSGTGGRSSPPRRDRERHPRPQVRRGTEPSPLRVVSPPSPLAIYGLAGGPGDGPQPGPLGCAHRSGRATGDHQDPPTAVLLHRRTAHSLGAPPHSASSPALALGKPVHSRLGPSARRSPASLTTRRRRPTRPPDNPWAVPPTHAQPSPPAPLPACRLAVFACIAATAGQYLATGVAATDRPEPHLLAIGPGSFAFLTHHPSRQR